MVNHHIKMTINSSRQKVLLTCIEIEFISIRSFVVELAVRERDVRTSWVGVLLAETKAAKEVESMW